MQKNQMMKILKAFKNAPLLNGNGTRTFLSAGYRCDEAWEKRLETSLLNKIKPVDLFLELDQKFLTDGKVSALDIDIFANSVIDDSHKEELSDIIHRMRLTAEATNILDSTHYAVVKYYLNIGESEELLNILDNRLAYGVLPDNVTYNMIMDNFIQKKEFGHAATAASMHMLQDDFEHLITNSLALYSCHVYLENPDSWKVLPPVKDEPKEEIKIRVRYLRNPSFDDHFDLWKPSDLVGKTLALQGKRLGGTLGRSCQLRGLILYKKYEAAINLIDEWNKASTKELVYKQVLTKIRSDVPELFEKGDEDDAKMLVRSLESLEKADLSDGDMEEKLRELVESSVSKLSASDIEEKIKNFSKWDLKRQQVLQKQIDELNKVERIAKVEKIKQELKTKEQILTFFDKEEEIEMAIETKLEKQKIQDSKIKTKKRLKIDEEYIPPDIRGQVKA